MLNESLDPLLESGIASICDGDWKNARELLGQRLEDCSDFGYRRLNLFLLSIVAARSGHAEASAELMETARTVPAEMAEPRYFGTSCDPVRQDLEQQWWSFNNWTPERAVSLEETEPAQELDWAAVLDGALEGRAGELERRWSRFLEAEHPHKQVLWNLLALGYLESGDLRTYEEMREQADTVSTPVPLPTALVALLQQAELGETITALESGRWITSEALMSPSGDSQPAKPELDLSWEEEMENAFSLLSVGLAVEAARKFGFLSASSSDPHRRAYSLNALSLALFRSGEYSQAQEALAESRLALISTNDKEFTPLFQDWLTSVGSSPQPGELLCDPFEQTALHGSALLGSDDSSHDIFWVEFDGVLQAMKLGDLGSCQQHLRLLLSQPCAKQPTEAFLLALLLAGTALLQGDHLDAQESIDDASQLLQGENFEANLLSRAQEIFESANAHTLAQKMRPDRLSTLDPWHDFTADFAL